jgi:hypothetical protein
MDLRKSRLDNFAGIRGEARPSNFLWVHVCGIGESSEVNSNCQSRFWNFRTTALGDGFGTPRRRPRGPFRHAKQWRLVKALSNQTTSCRQVGSRIGTAGSNSFRSSRPNLRYASRQEVRGLLFARSLGRIPQRRDDKLSACSVERWDLSGKYHGLKSVEKRPTDFATASAPHASESSVRQSAGVGAACGRFTPNQEDAPVNYFLAKTDPQISSARNARCGTV